MPQDLRAARQARHAKLRGSFRAALDRVRPGEEFNALALSGGGQWGAFGAGFLKGWTAREIPPKRPRAFDVVTGTSTGALIATFAFLGSSQDAAIGAAYLGIRDDSDVFTKRFKISLLWSDSVTTRNQFRSLLRSVVSKDVVSAVAAEHTNTGRRLLVGATELLSGEFHAFDLTEIAATGDPDAAWSNYIDALMASTAIPVQFSPVSLPDPAAEGAQVLYVDGGIRRNIFVDLLTSALEEGGAPRPPATLYCLVNGARDVGPGGISGFPKLLKIAERSTDILLNESTEGNLFRAYLQAQRARVTFRVAAVPQSAVAECTAQGSPQDRMFDHQVMQCLYDAGVKLAQHDPGAWQDDPLVGSP
jgi:predicted acylesterase/phospholipase RssA